MIAMWGFSQSWEITDLVPVVHGPLVPCDFPSLLLLWYLRLRKGIPGFQAQAIRRCPVKEGDDNILQEEHSPYLTVSDRGENACGSMFPNGLFAVERDPSGVQMGKWIHKQMRIKTWLRLSSGSLTLGCSLSAYLRHGTILKKIPGNNHFYSRFPGSNHSKSRCSIKLKVWLYKNHFTKHTGLCVWLLQVKGLEFNVVSVQDSIDFVSTYNTFTSPLRISSINWKLLIMIYGGKNLGNLD